jgi:hypothetical protein
MGNKYHVLHRHLSRLSRWASKSTRTMIWVLGAIGGE